MTTDDNCCVRCCRPFAFFFQPCATSFKADKLDFKLDDQPWKMAFGQPSCCPTQAVAFFALRVALFLVWFAVMIWSMVDWVGSYATAPLTNYTYNASIEAVVCPMDVFQCADGSYVSREPYEGCEFAPCPIRYQYGFWWTQLTHITLIFELVYLGFAAATTGMALYSTLPDGKGNATPWFVSVTWAMQPAALVASLMVFLLYWALLYTPGDTIHGISVVTHGINFLIMLVDFLVCRQPLYLAHIFMPCGYSVAYLLFTLLYFAGGGVNHEDLVSPYIYSVLDWGGNTAGTFRLGALILLLGVPILWIFLYCCFLARRATRIALTSSRVGATQGAEV